MGWQDDWNDEPEPYERPPVAPRTTSAPPVPPRPESRAMEAWRQLGIDKGWRAPDGTINPAPTQERPKRFGYIKR